jgi:hypothetical protein
MRVPDISGLSWESVRADLWHFLKGLDNAVLEQQAAATVEDTSSFVRKEEGVSAHQHSRHDVIGAEPDAEESILAGQIFGA